PGQAVNPRGRAGRVGGVLLAGDHDRAGAVRGRAGLQVSDGVPEHRRVTDRVDGDVRALDVGVGIADGVQPVVDGHLPADVLGRAGTADVLANDRREVRPGAG